MEITTILPSESREYCQQAIKAKNRMQFDGFFGTGVVDLIK